MNGEQVPLLRLTPKLLKFGFWTAVLVVAIGSLTPGDALPPIGSHDKLLHLLGHGGLAVHGGFAYATMRLRLVTGLVLFGAVLEVLQQWVPNRSFDWLDMVANVSGVLIAMMVVAAIERFRRPR